MADEPMTPSAYRDWLSEKIDAGVKQVRVTTALAQSPDPLVHVELGHDDSLLPGSHERDAMERELLSRSHERPVIYQTKTGPVKVEGVLVGTAEVAAILNVERPRVGRWRSLGHMLPPVVGETAAGPIWNRSDIEALRSQTEARRKPRKTASEEVPA